MQPAQSSINSSVSNCCSSSGDDDEHEYHQLIHTNSGSNTSTNGSVKSDKGIPSSFKQEEHHQQQQSYLQGQELTTTHSPSPSQGRFNASYSSSSPILILLLLLTSGIILGLILPKNPNLPPTFQCSTLSNIIGYSYFLFWSVSFYPQITLNYSKRNTTGLSIDFSLLNVLGFGCYSLFVSFLYGNETVREQYRHRFGDGGTNNDITPVIIPIQSNDVAFAIHAFILSLVQMYQIIYYHAIQQRAIMNRDNDNSDDDHEQQQSQQSPFYLSFAYIMLKATKTIVSKLHTPTKYFVVTSILICIIYLFLIFNPNITTSTSSSFEFLDFLYLASTIKLIITIIKYIPQVILNTKRQSTIGWNIWNVILDFMGGLTSLIQLFMDAYCMNDYTAIVGNWIKFGLSFVSLFFDVSCLFVCV
jgi:cystinosin